MVKKEFITTTGNFEGYKIDKYLGIVDERIVVGAGFLSDLFAAFTDTVGGRSGMYEQRIKELYDALIYGIQKQASKKGANAIVGLKIDVDEISGKGMSMFMATAVGTAVYINSIKINYENEIIKENIFDAKEIKKIITSEKYSEKIKNKELAFKDKVHLIEELNDQDIQIPLEILVNFIFESDFKNDTSTLDVRDMQFNIVLNYLDNYDEHEIAVEFNKKLSEINNDDKKLFYFIYKNAVKVYYEDVLALVNSLKAGILHKTVFTTLLKYKDTYSEKDIEVIDKIVNRLKQMLKIEDKLNNDEAWVCASCGQKNSGKNIWCKTCTKGKNGLTEDQEKMIKNIILHLVKINYILKTNSANKQ